MSVWPCVNQLATLLSVITLTVCWDYNICEHGKINVDDVLAGNITSPNYPRPYGNSRRCMMILDGRNRRIMISTINGEQSLLETSSPIGSCYDYLVIKENNKEVSERFCGHFSFNYTSVSSAVTLLFYSDTSTSAQGFKVRFQVTDKWVYEMCKHTDTVTTSEGYIVSENYPSNYENNKDCFINISAQENELLHLTIEYMNLEQSRWSGCADWIEINDTGFLRTRALLPKSCRVTDLPIKVTSSSNEVEVKFKSDYSVTKSGFKVTYTAVQVAMPSYEMCARTEVRYPRGYVVTPNYPGKYPNNKDCAIILRASDTHQRFRLSFKTFNLEQSYNCLYDSVKIYNGVQMLPEAAIETFCGTGLPTNITSPAENVTIAFHSDSARTGSGFKMRFEVFSTEVVTSQTPSSQTTMSPETTKSFTSVSRTYTALAHTSEKITETSNTKKPTLLISGSNVQTSPQTAINNGFRHRTPKTRTDQAKGDGAISHLVGGIVGGSVALCAIIVGIVYGVKRRKAGHGAPQAKVQQFSNDAYELDVHVYEGVNDDRTGFQPTNRPTTERKPIGQEGYYDYTCEQFLDSQLTKKHDQDGDLEVPANGVGSVEEWVNNDIYALEPENVSNAEQTKWHGRDEVDWAENDIYEVEDGSIKRNAQTEEANGGANYSKQSKRPYFDYGQQTKSPESDRDVEWEENVIYDVGDRPTRNEDSETHA